MSEFKPISDEEVSAIEQFERAEKVQKIIEAINLPRSTVLLLREYVSEDRVDVLVNGVPAWGNAMRVTLALCEPNRVGAVIGLIGPNGTGKTVMAAVVAYSLAEQLRRSRYRKTSELLDTLYEARNAYRGEDSHRSILERLSNPTLLILDEVDKRRHFDNEAHDLSRLIDSRYSKGLPTILIANAATTAEFEGQLDSSIVSRLDERGVVIECNWPTFRKPHKEADDA